MTALFTDYWPHYAIIADAAGVAPNPTCDHCVSFATQDGKELFCGVIFQNWTEVAQTMHMAVFDSTKVTRNALYHVFHYPFIQLKCERLFVSVPSTNAKALEIDRKLGFKELAVVPRAFPGADGVILGMEREDCKWLNYKPRPYLEPLRRKVA